jgi:nitrate/nitrite transporter NarK
MINQAQPEIIEYPRKRWFILGMVWLLVAIAFGNIQITSPFSFVLMPELQLNTSQFMMIYTAPILMAVLSSIPGGMLGDRLGPRAVVGAGSLIIGGFGLLRILPSSFGFEFGISLFLGVGWGLILPNLPKIIASWFPLKERGMVTGIYLTSIAIGTVFTFSTSQIFYGSDWHLGFTAMGICSMVIGVIWWLVVRNRQNLQSEFSEVSFFHGIKSVIKSKNLWLLAIAYTLFNGGMNALNGITPRSLITVHNVSPSIASMVVSMITLGSIGSIILPAISDRVGLRKPFLYAGALLSFGFIFLAWYTAFSVWTWIFMLAGGIALGIVPALFFTLPTEIPEINRNYVSSATGMITTLGNIGGFIIPSYLISALETPDMNLAFLVSTGLFGLIFVFALFMTETGFRAKKDRLRSGNQ